MVWSLTAQEAIYLGEHVYCVTMSAKFSTISTTVLFVFDSFSGQENVLHFMQM